MYVYNIYLYFSKIDICASVLSLANSRIIIVLCN